MEVGDTVQMMTGKYQGEVATIIYAYPGKGGDHYFRVQRDNGQVIERAATNLRLVSSTST